MTRNFGLSSPRHVGATTIPGALPSREAGRAKLFQLAGERSSPFDHQSPVNSEDYVPPSFIMERAAKWFALSFLVFVGAAVLLCWAFIILLTDWDGVAEQASLMTVRLFRLFNLG